MVSRNAGTLNDSCLRKGVYMRVLIILSFLIAGCSPEVPRLTRKGMAGYEYCLKNPKEALYMGEDIYTCEVYLIENKPYYEHTINDRYLK
jgi:hypothetical protein